MIWKTNIWNSPKKLVHLLTWTLHSKNRSVPSSNCWLFADAPITNETIGLTVIVDHIDQWNSVYGRAANWEKYVVAEVVDERDWRRRWLANDVENWCWKMMVKIGVGKWWWKVVLKMMVKIDVGKWSWKLMQNEDAIDQIDSKGI